MKRKLEELERESTALRRIVDCLQNIAEEDVSQVVPLIRSNADLSEVYQHIQDYLLQNRERGREPSPVLEHLNSQVSNVLQKQKSITVLEEDDSNNSESSAGRSRRKRNGTHVTKACVPCRKAKAKVRRNTPASGSNC